MIHVPVQTVTSVLTRGGEEEEFIHNVMKMQRLMYLYLCQMLYDQWMRFGWVLAAILAHGKLVGEEEEEEEEEAD